jgi:hypothetical protein
MDTSDSRKRLILALVCTAQFMVILDIAIVNVALPAITRSTSAWPRAPCSGS